MSAGRFYIGIDPGISGAIAVIEIAREADVGPDGLVRSLLPADLPGARVALAEKIPTLGAKGDRCVDARALAAILARFGGPASKCVLEKARAGGAKGADGKHRPMGGKSAFTYGHACGAIQACLDVSGIAYERLSPNTWRESLGSAGGSGDAPRKRGRAEAKKAIARIVRERLPEVGQVSQDVLDAVFLAMWAAGLVGRG